LPCETGAETERDAMIVHQTGPTARSPIRADHGDSKKDQDLGRRR
jgi:hypothetical protein